MIEGTRDAEHVAVDELLPWYVNGTLDCGEQARVRRHLGVCEVCRENASLLQRVNAIINRPAATPILPPQRPEALLASIDRSESAAARPWNGPALAAAASLAVAAAALLLWPEHEAGVPERPAYETATSTAEPTTMDYVMSIVFEPGVGPKDRQRILRELKAADIRHDQASGAYHVNVTLGAASLDELTRFTTTVEGRPEVRSARIVALQLPMQRQSAQGDR